MAEVKAILLKALNVFLVYILPAWILAVAVEPVILERLQQGDWRGVLPIVFNILLVVIGKYLKDNLPADNAIKKVL